MRQLSEAELVLKALTSRNIDIIATINGDAPESIAELARILGRSQSNVSRSLVPLVKLGIISLEGGRPKRPRLCRGSICLDLSEIQSSRVSGKVPRPDTS
ncbi:ArsR family transcriptional regulator [Chenggangzhangella methanolivorans]|uniref:ArsR family transcriptional regulator n=1 Tax=Chenggangzhangella methanolivorans TaxID=1437009 RepID=A0A9E6R8A6_9HYPH|nr:ArsR family transcriptional regulator [Chenggangzhangella methanolivorans]